MWLIALILAMVLGSGTAAAFDCSGVKFPPTVVICSDPELMRLADERQAAIYEARARIGEQAWPALWEDQKRWVRSYATACGVPPDRPPPIPVPASIKDCFKQAGEARIAYLRSYGVAAGSGSPASSQQNDTTSTMFQKELADRTAWENWFNGLVGDEKTGAFYWSGQRSLPNPGSCDQMNAAFERGCREAVAMLSPTDVMRESNPVYKLGWNSYTAPAPAPRRRKKRLGRRSKRLHRHLPPRQRL